MGATNFDRSKNHPFGEWTFAEKPVCGAGMLRLATHVGPLVDPDIGVASYVREFVAMKQRA